MPADQNKSFDVKRLIDALIDEGSWLEVQPKWAPELVVGYARLDGRVVGIVANQPKVKGGVLFVDSADKAARFIWTCNAFNVPLLFLADVPGFMIGSKVERDGIIRAGAKMISAVSEATVPKISVIVRKCYGAGLYAMAGPAFEPDCCLALPTAQIAVMGPEAAINAVFYNQIQAIEDPDERERFVQEKREEYAADIDILHLASELVVDAVIEPDCAAGRARPPVCPLRGQGPRFHDPSQRGHARLGTPARRVRSGATAAFPPRLQVEEKLQGWGIKESGRNADIRTHPARRRMLRIHRRRANSHLSHPGRSSVTRKRPAGQDGAFSRLGTVSVLARAVGDRAGASAPSFDIARRPKDATSISAALRSIARTTALPTSCGDDVPIRGGGLPPRRANMPASRMGPGVTSDTPTFLRFIWARSTCANPRRPNFVAV